MPWSISGHKWTNTNHSPGGENKRCAYFRLFPLILRLFPIFPSLRLFPLICAYFALILALGPSFTPGNGRRRRPRKFFIVIRESFGEIFRALKTFKFWVRFEHMTPDFGQNPPKMSKIVKIWVIFTNFMQNYGFCWKITHILKNCVIFLWERINFDVPRVPENG